MSESKNTMNSYTEQEGVKRYTRTLEMMSVFSGPPNTPKTPKTPDSGPKTLDLDQKDFYWEGPFYNGDKSCSIWGIVLIIYSDGTAYFKAKTNTSDSDDCWVFFGGISLMDNHDLQLFNSGKLVGPSMQYATITYDWETTFYYPAMFFDSIWRAQITGMHC